MVEILVEEEVGGSKGGFREVMVDIMDLEVMMKVLVIVVYSIIYIVYIVVYSSTGDKGTGYEIKSDDIVEVLENTIIKMRRKFWQW